MKLRRVKAAGMTVSAARPLPGVVTSHHSEQFANGQFQRHTQVAMSCWCERRFVMGNWDDIGVRTYSCGHAECFDPRGVGV